MTYTTWQKYWWHDHGTVHHVEIMVQSDDMPECYHGMYDVTSVDGHFVRRVAFERDLHQTELEANQAALSWLQSRIACVQANIAKHSETSV